MVKIISILLIPTLFFFILKNDLPSKQIIKRALVKILKKEYKEEVIKEGKGEIKFIKGHFNNFGKDECLALLPSINPWGRYYFNPILLFEKKNNEWKYADWYYLGANNISLEDLDNDHLSELLLFSSDLGTGTFFEGKKLISIKNKKEVVLYDKEGHDDSVARDPNDWEASDTISISYDIDFVDKDHDGIKEIIENTNVGFRDTVIDDRVIQKYVKSTKVIKLKNF